HLPVAASLREPGFGRLAQSTTLWASAADNLGQGTRGSKRNVAQTEGRHALECAPAGQRSRPVCGHGASHLAEVRTATPSGRNLQVQPGPGIRRKMGRHRGAVWGPAGASIGAVRGREIADSGT